MALVQDLPDVLDAFCLRINEARAREALSSQGSTWQLWTCVPSAMAIRWSLLRMLATISAPSCRPCWKARSRPSDATGVDEYCIEDRAWSGMSCHQRTTKDGSCLFDRVGWLHSPLPKIANLAQLLPAIWLWKAANANASQASVIEPLALLEGRLSHIGLSEVASGCVRPARTLKTHTEGCVG